MVKDPVCGMGVEEDAPETVVRTWRGRKYYFCCADCMLLFMKNPDEFERRLPDNRARDPVCGMEVDADNPPFTAVRGKMTYYFCSASCLIQFDASPNRYVEDRHA